MQPRRQQNITIRTSLFYMRLTGLSSYYENQNIRSFLQVKLVPYSYAQIMFFLVFALRFLLSIKHVLSNEILITIRNISLMTHKNETFFIKIFSKLVLSSRFIIILYYNNKGLIINSFTLVYLLGKHKTNMT